MNIFGNNLCELKINQKYGRYVIASKNIRRGELLLIEKPTIVGPYWSSVLCCVNCYRESMTMCKLCKRAPMCLHCTNHESFECDYLKASTLSENFLIDNFDAMSILRCLILRKKSETAFDEILKLESHCELRKNTEIWQFHQKQIINPLRMSGLLDDITDDFVQRLCGILDVNTFEIRTKKPNEQIQVRGLYTKASLLAHDCVANTFIALDENQTMKIYACIDINAGETIFYNYTDSLNGTIPRKEHLLKGKYFHCTCNRCLDPTEFGTHMSTYLCQMCIKNNNVKGNILYDETQNQWKCNECNKIANNINELCNEITHEISIINYNANDLENFIKKYSNILHPNHYLMLKVKHTLAGLLRMNTNNGTKRKTAQRLFDLCSEILNVLRIINPGISRLTGITLFEQYNQMIRLAQIDYESKIIKKRHFLQHLQKAEPIAKESIEMLIYEPPQTAEGKLAKQALIELKELRKHIAELQQLKYLVS